MFISIILWVCTPTTNHASSQDTLVFVKNQNDNNRLEIVTKEDEVGLRFQNHKALHGVMQSFNDSTFIILRYFYPIKKVNKVRRNRNLTNRERDSIILKLTYQKLDTFNWSELSSLSIREQVKPKHSTLARINDIVGMTTIFVGFPIDVFLFNLRYELLNNVLILTSVATLTTYYLLSYHKISLKNGKWKHYIHHKKQTLGTF